MIRRNYQEGQKIGCLTLLEKQYRTQPSGQIVMAFNTRCECGNEKVITANTITRRKSLKCSCKHGDSGSRPNRIFRAIHWRGSKKSNIKHYSSKGITVCDEWKDYLNFKEWALSNGYNDSLVIDRINNSEGYSPHNCRWSSPHVNAINRDVVKDVEYKGEIYKLPELLLKLGVYKSRGAIYSRRRRGFSIEEAIKKPIRKGNYFRGKTFEHHVRMQENYSKANRMKFG